MNKKVLAVGAGTMGSQASFYYAMHGRNVVQYDVSEESLAKCREYHRSYVEPFRLRFPVFTDDDIEAGLARITYSSDIAAAAKDADFVTESVPEVVEIKQQVYAQLNQHCPDHTVFTTNSSTLAPSLFAEVNSRAKWLIEQGSPQDVAITAWACGKLGVQAKCVVKLPV